MKSRSMHPGCGGSMRSQRGAAYLLTISAILGALTIMVMSFSSIAIQRKALNQESAARAALIEALEDVESQLRDPDSSISSLLVGLTANAVLSSDQIKGALSRPHLETIRYAISPSMQDCAPQSVAAFARCVSWRRFAAWIPPEGSPPSAPPWPLTNGLPEAEIQAASVSESRSNKQFMNEFLLEKENSLVRISDALRSWYFSRRAADPHRATSKNFWMPSFGCTYPRQGDLACRSESDFSAALLSSGSQDASELMRVLGLTGEEVFAGSPYVVTYKNEPSGSTIVAPMELRLHSTRNDVYVHLLIPPP